MRNRGFYNERRKLRESKWIIISCPKKQGCGVWRFLGFWLQQFWKTNSDSSSFKKPTPTPAFLKTQLRLQHFWKPDSDSSIFENPTPTPAFLKTRLRLQHFWKPDSDSSIFENPTPTPAFLKTRLRLQLKTRLRLQLKTCDSTNSDSTTLAVTAVVTASYL